MRDLYIKNGQGFVVVYSLTNHQTFQDIKTMKELITRVKGTERVPILLVANKVDLEHQREVSACAKYFFNFIFLNNFGGITINQYKRKKKWEKNFKVDCVDCLIDDIII